MLQADSSLQPAEELIAAVAQGRDVLQASFHACAAEMAAFFDALAKDDARAAREIAACRTPFELFAVHQRWLTDRAGTCVAASLRMALEALHEPETVAAATAAWRLPE